MSRSDQRTVEGFLANGYRVVTSGGKIRFRNEIYHNHRLIPKETVYVIFEGMDALHNGPIRVTDLYQRLICIIDKPIESKVLNKAEK